jgi:cephalosporin hydroxylase
MYPFWDIAVWPLIQAAKARRIVEIGALRGETTVLMLETLADDSELHVIDPVPEFDPSEHEARFPGRYIFHRALSRDVLDTLPAMDVALVDGDHNWYTVDLELRMLAESARRDGAPLPIIIMHDVLWPYGRRDLYYDPTNIPEEFRQPYEQRGMRPGESSLLVNGGINPLHYNAVHEGGPRNGVMTALDDFLAGFDRPVRTLLLPVYFGLAIVVEQARIDRDPELGLALDRLESAAGKDLLLEMAEETRLQAILFQHNNYYGHADQLAKHASRYLRLLSSALLDELYLDHELRLLYLAHCAREGVVVDPAKVGAPIREMQLRWEPLVERRRAGPTSDAWHEGTNFPYATMGRARLEHLHDKLDLVRNEHVGGDLVEVGTGRGGGAIYMRGYLEANDMIGKQVWVADRFQVERHPGDLVDAWADLDSVRDGFNRFELLDDRVRFLQGEPGDTLRAAPIERVAFVRIGPTSPTDIHAALAALYPRIVIGGIVVVEGCDAPERRQAVEDFLSGWGIDAPVDRADWSTVTFRKNGPAKSPGGAKASGNGAGVERRRVTRIPRPASTDALDLSVIVVFYNMRREAARTLHALSRAYQRGIETLDYEVIVVENGSAPDEVLGDDFVRGFGDEFRYLDLGDRATPSPADALNAGLELATGKVIAFMIDGAHVLTPGVLRYGIAGIRTYGPAITVTQQWYVGPGQQPDAMLAGYDRAYEDDLFHTIEWPQDGYRLFEIGHFIGDRDWFDGLWESNCIFVPRRLLEQNGAFDERFSEPGGGYANLELYERLGSMPDVNVVTILGEGSFHQLHGGTTTNVSDPSDRRATISAYADHFEKMHGRPFRGPGKNLHYVGSMFPKAMKTRARRMTGEAFVKGPIAHGQDGIPEAPRPIPDDLRTGFVEAFWQSLAWRNSSWLGRSIQTAPTDLMIYQELVEKVRPDWIIETGTLNGTRALFFASVCELLGVGQVVSIDPTVGGDRPNHPRITYLEGRAQDDATVEKVRSLVGPTARGLLLLGSRPGSNLRIEAEFEAYHDLVSVGSYAVIEQTIVNGHPVWPGFGPGPLEASKRILARHSEFAVDTTMERYGLTFNPGGYLKRLR